MIAVGFIGIALLWVPIGAAIVVGNTARIAGKLSDPQSLTGLMSLSS